MRTAASRIATAVCAVALVGTMAACSSSGSSDPTTSPAGSTAAQGDSSAPSTATTDYSSLLISASDIPVPGFTAGTPSAPPQGKGVSVAFTSAADNRILGDTILVLDSPGLAATAASASVTAAKDAAPSPEVTDAPIGDGGTAVRGSTDTQEIAVLVWHTGNVVVVLEFQSASGDKVPTSVIQAVATKQQSLIEANPPA